MVDVTALRESVELESRADLFAAACDFREAAHLMRQANAIRRREFGAFDPNELRERTEAVLHKSAKPA